VWAPVTSGPRWGFPSYSPSKHRPSPLKIYGKHLQLFLLQFNSNMCPLISSKIECESHLTKQAGIGGVDLPSALCDGAPGESVNHLNKSNLGGILGNWAKSNIEAWSIEETTWRTPISLTWWLVANGNRWRFNESLMLQNGRANNRLQLGPNDVIISACACVS